MSALGLRDMILCQGLHDCISVATGKVREVGAHLKVWDRHPSIFRGAPKTIQPFLASGVPTRLGKRTNQILWESTR